LLLSLYTRIICAPFGRLVHVLVACGFGVAVALAVLTIADWNLPPAIRTHLWPIAAICVFATAVPLSLFSATLIVRLDRLSVRLSALAATDTLTNTLNRRGFVERTLARLRACDPPQAGHHVIMLDIDHFKTINDNFGHIVGDEALRLVAETTRCSVRASDPVGRLGGEEFVIAQVDGDAKQARRSAERIRRNIESLSFIHNGQRVPLSASVGVARVHGKTLRALNDALNRADDALYRAKKQGRNRVVADWDQRADPAAMALAGGAVPLRRVGGRH